MIGLAAVPLSGIALDHFGPRDTLLTLMIGMAAAETGLAFVHSPEQAIPVLALLGVVQGATFPAYTVMLAAVAGDGPRQQRAFAVNFTVVNAGIGMGGVIGGLVVDVHRPVTFMALFLGNALSFALFALVIARLPDVRPAREPDAPHGSYRRGRGQPPPAAGGADHAAARAHRLRRARLGVAGVRDRRRPRLGTGRRAGARGQHRAHRRLPAPGAAAGPPVASEHRAGRRRHHLGGELGAFSLCALPSSSFGRDAIVFGFAALFGVGETFMAPTVSPLINALADERVRGRANAMSSSMYSLAFVISPSISAFLISAGLSWLWITGLCLGCCGTVALSRVLRRRLPTGIDRVLGPEPGPGGRAAAGLSGVGRRGSPRVAGVGDHGRRRSLDGTPIDNNARKRRRSP